MTQIDQTFVLSYHWAPDGVSRIATCENITIEMHAGNGPGSPGVNPKGPAEAPSIPPSYTGPQLNITVGSQKIVNPA
jgi:hypothetical protein